MNPGKSKMSLIEKQAVAAKHGGTYPDIIFRLFQDGKHPQEIALIFDMTDAGVYYQLGKRNPDLLRRGTYKYTEQEICAVYNDPKKPAEISAKTRMAVSTIREIKRPTKRYRWILEKHGLIKKITEKPKKKLRVCLKCERQFDPGSGDFRLCRSCRASNAKTSDEYIYTPRLSGTTNKSRY